MQIIFSVIALSIFFNSLLAQSQVAVKNHHAVTSEVSAPVVKTIQLATGVNLEYAEQGNKNCIPVILLHGFTDSWKSFETVLSHLSPSFHVCCFAKRAWRFFQNAEELQARRFCKRYFSFYLAKETEIRRHRRAFHGQCQCTMFCRKLSIIGKGISAGWFIC